MIEKDGLNWRAKAVLELQTPVIGVEPGMDEAEVEETLQMELESTLLSIAAKILVKWGQGLQQLQPYFDAERENQGLSIFHSKPF